MAPKWKKEFRTDHKFDYVEISDFRKTSLFSYIGYSWVYIQILKGCAIYCSDLWTAISLLAFNKWNSSVQPKIPFAISKWIFSGCIIFSYLLLIRDLWICRRILKSRDIATAYFNINAQRIYCVRNFDYYCLFQKLTESKKKKDDFAFFVLFAFKGWKRLMLAEGPRQLVNGFTIYSILKAKNFSYNIEDYNEGTLQDMISLSMVFSAAMWVISAVQLVLAAFLYVPLITFIRGNLKEYCCVKVDKRLSKLMAHYRQKRLFKGSKKKDSKSPAPTLPNIKDIELDSASTFHYGMSDSASISSRQQFVRNPQLCSVSPSGSHPQRNITNMSSSSSAYQTSIGIPGSLSRSSSFKNQQVPPSFYKPNTLANTGPGLPSRAHTMNKLPIQTPANRDLRNRYLDPHQQLLYSRPIVTPPDVPTVQVPHRSRTAPPRSDHYYVSQPPIYMQEALPPAYESSGHYRGKYQ